MHDFPGYALFCGWCTSGKMPCPVCMQALIFIWLKKGGKYVAFDLHRQFLPPDHPDREDKKNFTKGIVVHEVNEIPTFSGEDVLAQLKALKLVGEGKGKGKGKATGEDEGEGKGKGKGKNVLKDTVRRTTGLTLPPSRSFPILRTSNFHTT